ncbi:hypothetical protein STABA_v1c04900 [Spiroplasma tabanidicola]|uniref:GmrSD restriction endonucleases N-terminal domain-containing protein n=2 Tax=Spiroplasma tabanidicola TaxID=324079 RepID=A0A6I6CIG6_9MOLU|nr:hypothetical protein STABA_v1c04900 [Spiroplasma tabanidicola]
MIEREEIILQPDFQRKYVWNETNASKFIESLLLNIPIPNIFVYENNLENWEVIDGQQRLTTIYKFFNNEFNLKNLNAISELNGKTYEDFSDVIKRKFNNVILQFTILGKETSEFLKFDIFSRLNKGSTMLNAQELRNCLYKGAFKDLLKELSTYLQINYRSLLSENMRNRMLDEELILRFFYIDDLYNKNNNFNNYKNISIGMNEFMNEANKLSYDKIDELKSIFIDSIKKVAELFKEKVFKVYEKNINSNQKNWGSKINRGVFEIEMSVLRKYDSLKLLKKEKVIIEKLADIMLNDNDFSNSLKIHTNNKNSLIKRFETFEKLIKGIMESD